MLENEAFQRIEEYLIVPPRAREEVVTLLTVNPIRAYVATGKMRDLYL